ncbi:hypothetical protein DID88_006874 [Monilinia fructigena]|uniref:Branched-chain-amino-acid aminotransferase n=1 Tax=Monilinia fructigena TaxID=38457 RepID=A0A395IGB1_9HELO|nr:hypothetical protein DID88_006874 [Monilinia fructigena]
MNVPAAGDPIINTASQCTDHMITAVWNSATGWGAPELKPYGNLSLALQLLFCSNYATECFEGMKMYRDLMENSDCSVQIATVSECSIQLPVFSLPGFDPKELEKLIIALVSVDGPKWLPEPGSFLYLRPTMIGSAGALGVAAPKECTMFVISTFMPPMNPPNGMKLLASQEGVRAWPGGFGFAKVGANYGPTLMANSEARSGAMINNFLVVWETKEGKKQLVTAPLKDKIILDGVTEEVFLQLVRERIPELEIVERNFTMDELAETAKRRSRHRGFRLWKPHTSSLPCPKLTTEKKDIDIPMSKGNSGEYAGKIKQWLVDIMYGNEEHEWGVVIDEVGA